MFRKTICLLYGNLAFEVTASSSDSTLSVSLFLFSNIDILKKTSVINKNTPMYIV